MTTYRQVNDMQKARALMPASAVSASGEGCELLVLVREGVKGETCEITAAFIIIAKIDVTTIFEHNLRIHEKFCYQQFHRVSYVYYYWVYRENKFFNFPSSRIRYM